MKSRNRLLVNWNRGESLLIRSNFLPGDLLFQHSLQPVIDTLISIS